MRARDLAQPFPTVSLESDAMEAVRLMAREQLPGLIVCEGDGRPYTVLPGSQILRFLVPRYVQDDPALARVYDEKASDELISKLVDSTVRDLLPHKRDIDDIPVVDGNATTIEVAAVMARAHSPVAAVVENHQVLGAITVRHLLDQLMPSA